LTISSTFSENGKGLIVLVILAFFYFIKNEMSQSQLVEYLADAHYQLARFNACRCENGAFLRLAITYLGKRISSQTSRCPQVNSAAEETTTEETDETEKSQEEQLLQCLSCLYNVQLCDAKKISIHHGRQGRASPETPHQAADLMRAILPFIRRPARLPVILKNSASEALQLILSHFQFPPAHCYQHVQSWVLSLLDGKCPLKSSPPPPLAVTDEPYHEVYENLYFLLARCIRKEQEDDHQLQCEGKEKQLNRARLYKQDLFVKPSRTASWVALGKHYAQKLEQLLDEALPWRPCDDPQMQARVVKYYVRAERCLEQAIELDPERTPAILSLAELIYDAIRFCRLLPDWGIQKQSNCQRAHSTYERLHSIHPDWHNLYWMAKLERKMGLPAKLYLGHFDEALGLLREKNNKRKSEYKQYKAELIYQLHASRLKELCKADPDYDAVARHMFQHENHTEASTAIGPMDQRKLLFNDVVSALTQPHHIYAYFHKSLYRRSWALRDQGRVEEAKAQLGAIFNEKKLSRQFTQICKIWRVNLDRAGKFEHYRRKYLLLYNELLRDTYDVDRLEALVLKLSKDSILSGQHDVAAATCSALVQALTTRLGELSSRMEHHQSPCGSAQIDLTDENQREAQQIPNPPAPISRELASVVTPDKTQLWLRRSYEAHEHASVAFARPFLNGEGVWDREAEQGHADQMLVRCFRLYLDTHPTAGNCSSWDLGQITSFCRQKFKLRSR